VRKHFLMPRYLRDYLKIIAASLDDAAPAAAGAQVG
jgi:hypothetical protein